MLERTGSNSVTNTVIEGGKLYFHTIFNDDAALHQNTRLRNSGHLDRKKLGLHEDEDVRMMISIPSVLQYTIFQKKHPNTITLLNSKIESERMRGAKQLQILHPEWVVMERL